MWHEKFHPWLLKGDNQDRQSDLARNAVDGFLRRWKCRMIDIQPSPTDKEFLELRSEWKGLNGKISAKVTEAREAAERAKVLQADYLVAEGDDIAKIRQKLADAVTVLKVRLRECEALRADAFLLSKKFKVVAARWAQAERNLRTTLAEKAAAEAVAATISEIGGQSCDEISRLIRSIVV